MDTLENRRLLSTYYVDGPGGAGLSGGGSDSAYGTSLSTPWLTIQHALDTAVAGDTICIRGGVYREQLIVKNGHYGAAGAYLTLQNYGTETPDIRGSQQVANWQLYQGNVWKKTNWTSNSQQVFYNGAPLQQIGRPPSSIYNPNDGTDEYPIPVGSGLADLASHTNSFYYDASTSTLYVQLNGGITPNDTGVTMEASVGTSSSYGRTFMANAGQGYIKLKGLTFQHSNTSAWLAQGHMVNVGSNSIVDSCTFKYADFSGLCLGWGTTNVQVVDSQFINNGDIGLTVAGTTNFSVTGSTFTGNNYRNFNSDWHAGGIKVAADHTYNYYPYGVIDGNEFGSNNGSAIWFDSVDGSASSTIRNNYVHDTKTVSGLSMEGAVFFEASHHGLIYNNVLANNDRRGVYVSGSDDAKIYNNTVVGTTGLSAIALLPRNGVDPTNTLVKNNIISGSTATSDIYMSGAGNACDYNDIYRSTGPIVYYNGQAQTWTVWQNTRGYDQHSTTGNPCFASTSGASYTLYYASPARDAGTTLTEVATDYAATARPSGAAYDMGAYELQIATPAMVAYWNMDANAQDSSGYGNNGTVHGTTWATGRVGANSIQFNGTSSDYVAVPDSSSLDFTNVMSIGGWFCHSSSGGGDITGIDKQNAYRLTAERIDTVSSRWQFLFYDTSGVAHTVTTSTPVSDDAWHHIMGTYDGLALKIYVDGKLDANAATSFVGAIRANSASMRLGQRDYGYTGAYYAGKMDEIRLYNYALSANDIANLAYTLNSDRAGYWNLDQNANDASGSNNDGTIYAGSSVDPSPTWCAGQVGSYGLTFSAANQERIVVPDNSSLDLTDVISVGGWFNHSTVGGSGTTGVDKIHAYRLTAQEAGTQISPAAGSHWQFTIWDSSNNSYSVQTDSLISNGVWHQITGTYDGSYLRIYVDGVEAATPVEVQRLQIQSNNNPLTIGSRDGTIAYFDGSMDDIRVYHRALDLLDIRQLAAM